MRSASRWLAAAIALALAALAAPHVLWAYEIARAGALIERGMAWPAPRQADSLPVQQDAAALDEALAHLERARIYRAAHPHADRLVGHIALARGDWQAAAAALGRARAASPRNPQLAWEAALAYEQIYRAAPPGPAASAALSALRTAWRDAGAGAEQLRARGDDARNAGRAAEAEVWYARASLAAPGEQAPGSP